jgi:hypothetical protein
MMGKGIVLSLLLLVVLVVAGGVLLHRQAAAGYELVITEAQLRERLAERLPLTRSWLRVVQVTLDRPRVALVEGSDRIDGGVDIRVDVGLGATARRFDGALDLSTGVRYDPASGQFHLTDPVIERLVLQGLPERHVATVRDALASALAEYCARRPIHTLRSDDLRQQAVRWLLREVAVRERQLVLTIGP